MTPQRIVHDVRQVMPEDGIVCLDKIWFARNDRTHVANTLLLDNALATMGVGLPSAMMASLLYPDQRVLAVCGDGGFMMNSQEMETAVRLHLNLVVLVLQDNAYGMIRGQGRQGDLSARTSLSTPPIARQIWVLLIDAKHHRLSGALRQALEPKPFSAT